MYENNFYQYRLGLLSDEHWKQQENRILNNWNECEYRHIYVGRLESFMNYLSKLPDKCS